MLLIPLLMGVFAYQHRKRLERLIASIVAQEPLMLRCMQLLGIGKINAFGLLAIIGDVRRFAKPACLSAYLGLNPGLKSSGTSKRFKTGVGKHGRRDLRALLIQAAHAVMNYGRGSALHSWGWKLMCKKGHRNIAIAAVARKLVVQVWYLLSGKRAGPTEGESTVRGKLLRLLRELGEEMRAALQLPGTLAESVDFLYEKHLKPPPAASS